MTSMKIIPPMMGLRQRLPATASAHKLVALAVALNAAESTKSEPEAIR
jgi:hypothetical protein